MYWQKRFDRENPDIELEEKIHEIHKCNKDYGYRRMCGELRNQGPYREQEEGSTHYAEI